MNYFMDTKAIGDLDAVQQKIDFSAKNRRFFNQEERELNSFHKKKEEERIVSLLKEFDNLFPDEIWMKDGKPSYKENKSSYSEEELQFFKKIILLKIEEAKENIIEISLDESSHADFIDRARDHGQITLIQKMNKRAEDKIKELNNALEKIERKKRYGICLKTKKIIHPKRLFLVPYALFRI